MRRTTKAKNHKRKHKIYIACIIGAAIRNLLFLFILGIGTCDGISWCYFNERNVGMQIKSNQIKCKTGAQRWFGIPNHSCIPVKAMLIDGVDQHCLKIWLFQGIPPMFQAATFSVFLKQEHGFWLSSYLASSTDNLQKRMFVNTRQWLGFDYHCVSSCDL